MTTTSITVHDVLADVDLASISYVELCAVRVSENVGEEVDQDEKGIDPTSTLRVQVHEDHKKFRVLLRTDLDLSAGRITCEVAADYDLRALLVEEIPLPALQDFVNEVSVMQILPYTRQGIADLTLRVFESALLMPIMVRGGLSFTLGPTEHAPELPS